jgi:hypothetical protein
MCRVYELYHGNNMEILPTLETESIDAIILRNSKMQD